MPEKSVKLLGTEINYRLSFEKNISFLCKKYSNQFSSICMWNKTLVGQNLIKTCHAELIPWKRINIQYSSPRNSLKIGWVPILNITFAYHWKVRSLHTRDFYSFINRSLYYMFQVVWDLRLYLRSRAF